MKTIYWDMDDTILCADNGNVRVFNMARQMLGTCWVMGYECHLLTTSIRSRALKLIEAHYPTSFKTITAREDFTDCSNVGWGGIEWHVIVHDFNPKALLVDNDISTGKFKSNGISAQLKTDYLGVDQDRCFAYNNFDHQMPEKFVKFLDSFKNE